VLAGRTPRPHPFGPTLALEVIVSANLEDRRIVMSNRSNPQFPVGPMRLRPTWTTWAYLGFAVATAIATVVGFWLAGRPFWP